MGKTLFFGIPVLKSQPKPEYPGKRVVALDFDGVLNSYSSGWKGATETDGPVPGAAAALRSLWERGYKIVIYSTRAETPEGVQAIRDFLAEKMDIDEKGIEITDRKPIAEVYVDDRAINFSGDWDSTLKEIFGFESWVGKSLTFSGWKLQGRTKIHGMDISIENRKGSVRRGKDKDGHAWETKMHYAYGYIRGTVGKDKDHLDCYIGPNPESRKVFIVHQNDPTTGKYDEDKCMLGFDSAEEAKAAYLKQYDRPGFFGSMEETDIDTFKEKALSKENHGKRLVVKSIMEKAKSAHLVPRRVMVTRDGKTFPSTVWVNPELGIQQGSLFDLEPPKPKGQVEHMIEMKEQNSALGKISRATGRTKKESKEFMKKMRKIQASQGLLVEDNKTKGKDLKNLPLYQMTRDEWAELRILNGKRASELSDRGLLNRIFTFDLEKKEHREDTREQLVQELGRRVKELSGERGGWADEHDHSVRYAIEHGIPVDPATMQEFYSRSPREEWDYSVEDWYSIREFGKPLNDLTVEEMKTNWEKVAPQTESVTLVPELHYKTGEQLRSLFNGEPVFSKKITYTKAPIPETDKELKGAFQEYVDEMSSLYKESAGKVTGGSLVHYRRVKNALREGFKVPAAAVAYYPDLREKYKDQIKAGELKKSDDDRGRIRMEKLTERRHPEELAVGIKVEAEHTDDPAEARRIAMDHLIEDPHYYTKLIAAGLVDEPEAVQEAKKHGLKKSIRLVVPVVR